MLTEEPATATQIQNEGQGSVLRWWQLKEEKLKTRINSEEKKTEVLAHGPDQREKKGRKQR